MVLCVFGGKKMKYFALALILTIFINAKETSSNMCRAVYHKKSNQIYNDNGYVETKSEYKMTNSKNENSTSSFTSSTILSDGGDSKFEFNHSAPDEDLTKQYKISLNKKGEVEFNGKTYHVLDKKYKKAKNLKDLANYSTIRAKDQKGNSFLQILEQNKELKLRTIFWNNKGRFEFDEYICK